MRGLVAFIEYSHESKQGVDKDSDDDDISLNDDDDDDDDECWQCGNKEY